MKRVVILVFSLTIMLGLTSFAQEKSVLTIEDIKQNISNNIQMKKLDLGRKKLANSCAMASDMASMIDFEAQKQFKQDLNQEVEEDPITVYYMGSPVVLDHTLSYMEKREILKSFGIPITPEEKLQADLTKNLMPQKLVSQLKLMEKNKKVIKKRLNLTSKQMFYNILLTNKGIELQQEVINATKKQLDFTDKKYEKGMISKKEIEKLEHKYQQELIKLNKKKRSKQNLIYTINKLMGVSLDTEYDKIKGNVELKEIEEIDTEKMISQALQNRLEILRQKEDIKYKQLEFDITKEYFPFDFYSQYKTVQNELKKEQTELEKVKKEIKFEIKNACKTVNKNYLGVKKAQKNLSIAQREYKDIKQKYDKGLITEDVLGLTHVKVSAAEMQLLSAINQYNISCEKLNAATGLGPSFE